MGFDFCTKFKTHETPVMAEPSLQDVFGSGATQSSANITIAKADLASVGLTAQNSNTAESIFVSLILLAARSLTEANRATDNVNRNVTVPYGGQDISGTTQSPVLRDVYSVLMYRPYSLSPIDPDNF